MRHATAGEKILGSIREARAILRGESKGELVVHVPPEFDVEALRRNLRHRNAVESDSLDD